jgi:[acyl-carrier-protein] S-malonyltransferase
MRDFSVSEGHKFALLFPGQGCQFVSMGAELYRDHPEARALLQRADDILGFSITRLCLEGPEADLDDTANAQPAIYAVTMALWQVLAPRLAPLRPRIAAAAGHSLGEFSALTAAGALSFEDGLRLVRRRGLAMRDAGQAAPGGMAVILGLSDESVAQIVSEASANGQRVWIANFNALGQVVIAGAHEALARAMELAKAAGARRAMPLAVSVACHTPLMREAAQQLQVALEETTFKAPWVPVVSNVLAQPLADSQAIKAALLRQLTSPVRWVASVQAMAAAGVTTMVEIGPKPVVAALVQRIDRSLAVHTIADGAAAANVDGEAWLA